MNERAAPSARPRAWTIVGGVVVVLLTAAV